MNLSLKEQIDRLSPEEQAVYYKGTTAAEREQLTLWWPFMRRPDQVPPRSDWRCWLLMAGRGFGKTRTGAEWVKGMADSGGPQTRIALVGATAADARHVMVEGESGLLNIGRPDDRPEWSPSTGELRWSSGATGRVFSAERPDALRGPQFSHGWCDEIAKWANAEGAWDNLAFGLRLGPQPRVLATTTPRPVPLIKRLLSEDDVVVRRGATADNRALPPEFVAAVTARYGGTRLGRQELQGELVEDLAGALWTRDLLERSRTGFAGELVRTVVAVDPPASVGGDACGIVAAALRPDGVTVVLEDASVAGLSPPGWARAVADCAARVGADRVVAEANNGGVMVEQVLRAADAVLPVKLVHATRGKVARAEPVAALYAAGKVRHAGAFPALEDELCGLLPGGYEGPSRSPDRADALVWAITELLLGRRGPEPRVRRL